MCDPLPTDKLCHRLPGGKPVVLVSCGSFNPPTVMHARVCQLATQHLLSLGRDVWGCFLSPVGDAYSKPGLALAAHRVAMCQALSSESSLISTSCWEAQQSSYTPSLYVLRHTQQELGQWLRSGGQPLPLEQSHEQPVLAGSSQDSASANAADHHQTVVKEQQPGQGAEAAASTCTPQAAAAAGQQSTGHPPTQRAEVPQVMLLCGADVLESLTRPGVWHQPDTLLQEHGVVCVDRMAGHGALAPGRIQALIQEEGNLLNRFKDNIIIVPAEDNPISEISSTLVRLRLQQQGAARADLEGLVAAPVQQYLRAHPDLYQTP